MLIAARNGFLVGKRILPPGARWVEYLESTGSQWIETGVSASNTSSSLQVAASLRFTSLSNIEEDLMGSGNAQTPTIGRIWTRYYMWAQSGSGWQPEVCDTNWHEVSFTFNNPSGRVFELDGTLYSGTQSNTFQAGDGVHIFASGPNRFALRCQLAKLTIWQDGIPVRDFRPIAIGTTGYMLDLVSGDYLSYGNKGTGAFVIGPDV